MFHSPRNSWSHSGTISTLSLTSDHRYFHKDVIKRFHANQCCSSCKVQAWNKCQFYMELSAFGIWFEVCTNIDFSIIPFFSLSLDKIIASKCSSTKGPLTLCKLEFRVAEIFDERKKKIYKFVWWKLPVIQINFKSSNLYCALPRERDKTKRWSNIAKRAESQKVFETTNA